MNAQQPPPAMAQTRMAAAPTVAMETSKLTANALMSPTNCSTTRLLQVDGGA
jgi:hypothetical protein